MQPNNAYVLQEFDRQVETLLRKKYPKAAHLSEDAFLHLLKPLKNKLEKVSVPEIDVEGGTLPFVIVINDTVIDSETMMARVDKDGKQGVAILRPHTTKQFHTISGVQIPEGSVYLLIDIDRGKETINLPPKEVLQQIVQAGRSPLTIDEGIAIVTQFPDFLKKNNCFSLLASRTGADQRVPAIWINAKKQPNLGWCWDGNPHTWLGSASGKYRIGV